MARMASSGLDAGSRSGGGARRAPSRFDRRIVALLALGAVVLLALGLQYLRLAVVEHSTHRANVERYLVTKRLLPAPRGRIVDRRGEVLSADRASWDVLIEYEAITGRWAHEMARRDVQREIGRPAWLEMSASERINAVLAKQGMYDAQVEEILARISEAGGLPAGELDRRLDGIVARATREARSRKDAMRERELRLYGDDARIDDIERERVGAQTEAHVVLADVADEVAFFFQRLAEEYPGTVGVEPSTRRVRPWERVDYELVRSTFPTPVRSTRPAQLTLVGVADHLVGSTRSQVFPEDLAARPLIDRASGEIIDLGGYRADRDVIGATGIERRREADLRGMRGIVERDLESGEESRRDPVAGRDIALTIDIRLQARIQALFAPESDLATIHQYQRGFDPEGNPRGGPLPLGWQLDGAVVALDVATGEILAAVSAPTLAEGAAMGEDRRRLSNPAVFKPFEAIYPPGSILKPLILCAAAAEGKVRAGEAIECTGHFFPERNDAARCWLYRANEGRTATHGPLGPEEALARSCNIYFYELADRLGPERTVAWLRRFGLGALPGSGFAGERTLADGRRVIVGESEGDVPSPEDAARMQAKRDRMGAILLGIGQGPLAWTPLQAAQAYATLARGGISIPPTILRERLPPTPVDLGIPRHAIDAALGGLRDSVAASYGTGHHITLEDGGKEELFNIPGVRVWGKTGTATAPLLPLDSDKDGAPDARVRTDHAWFVGLAGESDGAPAIAIAVILENGGSGGKVAGPIAAQVIRALAIEGYLGELAQRVNEPPKRGATAP